jgi:hypothetical protein
VEGATLLVDERLITCVEGATLLVGERPAVQVSMMFEKKPVHILTWHTTIEDHTPYPSPQQVLGSSEDQALTTITNLQ